MRSPDRVQWEQWLRWVRARPWPVWAAGGTVFVLFALLGAVTRQPATSPVAAHSLAEGIERGTGATAAPLPSATPVPGQPRYPGVAYPPDSATPAPSTSTPSPTPSVYFANCAAAEAAGAVPIPRGEPGYRPGLDSDGDGVACDVDGRPSSSPTTPPATPTPTPTTSPSPVPTATGSPTPSPTPEPTSTDPAASG